MLNLRLPRLSDPAAPPPALAAPSRAAELLTAAAAHRAFVEHCLDHGSPPPPPPTCAPRRATSPPKPRTTCAPPAPPPLPPPPPPPPPPSPDEQQTGHQLAEMVEGWVTGEDAFEVALWHIQADTSSPAHGKRPRTGTAPARGPGPVPGSIAHRQSAQPLAHRRWNQAQVSARRQEVREQVEPSRAGCSVAAEQEQRLCRLLALRAGCSVAAEQEQRLLWGKRPPPHARAALTPSPHKIPRASLAGSVPWTVVAECG